MNIFNSPIAYEPLREQDFTLHVFVCLAPLYQLTCPNCGFTAYLQQCGALTMVRDFEHYTIMHCCGALGFQVMPEVWMTTM